MTPGIPRCAAIPPASPTTFGSSNNLPINRQAQSFTPAKEQFLLDGPSSPPLGTPPCAGIPPPTNPTSWQSSDQVDQPTHARNCNWNRNHYPALAIGAPQQGSPHQVRQVPSLDHSPLPHCRTRCCPYGYHASAGVCPSMQQRCITRSTTTGRSSWPSRHR